MSYTLDITNSIESIGDRVVLTGMKLTTKKDAGKSALARSLGISLGIAAIAGLALFSAFSLAGSRTAAANAEERSYASSPLPQQPPQDYLAADGSAGY